MSQSSSEKIYYGEKVCRECHHLQGDRNQFNDWRKSSHAKAYTSLFKPEARQIADLSGINVEPVTSPICLGCHTTAYYVEAWERDPTFHFEDGIQCEACHGPGSSYLLGHSQGMMIPDLLMPEKDDCLVCHKEKNSHVSILASEPFDYASALRQIDHSGKGGELVAPETASADHLSDAYVCAECHNQPNPVFSEWHQSSHALAYTSLAGAKALQIAREMGVTESPQQSPLCLGCHTSKRVAEESNAVELLDSTRGVQCESCHGPAQAHVGLMSGLTSEPGTETGLQPVQEEICRSCHQNNIHGVSFDFDSSIKMVDHTKWQYTRDLIEYKTPFNMAITKNGERLYIACEASNSMIVLNVLTGEVVAEVGIGMQPHFVCLSDDERHIYVSNRASDNISVIESENFNVMATIDVGDEPHEMAISQTGTILYVANTGSYDVSVVDLTDLVEVKRIPASRGPWGAALSQNGRWLYISNNLPRYVEFRTTSESEITVIDTKTSTVKYRHTLKDANLVQGIAVAPGDEFVLMTLIRTKNLIPMTRNLQGWIITNGIGILWPDGRVDQVLLDSVEDFFADPTDVVFSKDGAYAFVSGGGVQEIAVIDIRQLKRVLAGTSDGDKNEVLPNHLGISLEYVIRRIPVGNSPRGMVVSPDNQYLYIADGLDDQISVIDIQTLERVRIIDLKGPKQLTKARIGERIFHDAQYTFARQFSCHSCHPDGGIDGLTYDIEPDGLGLNPVDNRTLRGINDTAPFKWTGKNPTLRRQCGARLAAFFTRIDPFTPEQSAALDHYIVTIPRPPNRFRKGNELTEAQRRGKRIFERTTDNSGNPIPALNRCIFCHTPPYYTNRKKFDVGTSSRLDTHGVFDVPHLNNIYATAPYLHDGRAHSLEEIWTIYNQKDKHGLTNDLTKDQLNDLIEYLKTL